MTDRDQLAALIRDSLDSHPDGAYVETDWKLDDVRVDGVVDLLKVADAILAAGWRAPEPDPEPRRRVAAVYTNWDGHTVTIEAKPHEHDIACRLARLGDKSDCDCGAVVD